MNPNIESDGASLRSLSQRVSDFNQENSGSARAAQSLGKFFRAMFSEETETDLPPKEPKKPTDTADKIFDDHKRTLAALGLELSVNRGSSEIASLNKQLGRSEQPENPNSPLKIELQLVDSERLLKFLRKLQPKNVQKLNLSDALQGLSTSLDSELTHRYCVKVLSGADEGWESFCDGVAKITSELSRLNLKSAAATLSAHLERSWEGDLTEYLLADQAGLLTREGFGPSTWHHDSTAKTYRQNWEKALEVTEKISENPRAGTLFESVLSYLRESAENAQNEITTALRGPEREDQYWRDHGQGFLTTLEFVEQRLGEIENGRGY